MIRFGEGCPSLASYEESEWQINEVHDVEFFPGVVYNVNLISVEDPSFIDFLEAIKDGEPMAIDLEWETDLCLFQFCSSKGVVIIRHPQGPGNEQLKNFLKSNYFYGKGMHNDKQQLQAKFGEEMTANMEDISRTRLEPYEKSLNFKEMTREFAGEPTAEFKDVKITLSNWEVETLTARQVLYAAFDVVALHRAYPNFPPAKVLEKKRKQKERVRSKKNIKKPPRPHLGNYHLKFTEHPSKRLIPFIITGYSGNTSPIELRKEFDGCSFVSSYVYNDVTYLFLAYEEGSDTASVCEKLADKSTEIRRIGVRLEGNRFIPCDSVMIDPSDSTDADYLYLNGGSAQFKKELWDFLQSMDVNVDVLYDENNHYCRIEPRWIVGSYRIKIFLTNFIVDGKEIELYDFPDFLPMVRVMALPPMSTKLQISEMFSGAGTVESVEVLRRRDPLSDPITAFVSFSSEKEAERAVEIMHNRADIRVVRYTDEQHLRVMRSHELVIEGADNKAELINKFSGFGPLHQVYIDHRYNIAHIQFYKRKHAIAAQKEIPDAKFVSEGRILVFRDLSFNVTDEFMCELCAPFGRITNHIMRDINHLMRFIIREVTFSNEDEARAAKIALASQTIGENAVRVAVLNGGRTEVFDWKTGQRKQWVKVFNTTDHQQIYEAGLATVGRVLDLRVMNNATFIMFPSIEEAEDFIDKCEEPCDFPYIPEFVELNSGELLFIEEASPRASQKDASVSISVVVDDLDPTITEEQIIEKYSEHREFCSTHIVPSLKFENRNRAVIYSTSRSMANKIYTLLNNSTHNGEVLKPVRMRSEDVPNPPDIPASEIPQIPKSHIRKVLVIDPVPEDVSEGTIRDICKDMDVTITVYGQKIVISANTSQAKRQIYKALSLAHIHFTSSQTVPTL